MFSRWFGRRKSPEPLGVRSVHYLCEHDGTPERQLKGELRKLFELWPGMKKAYLAVVSYQDGADRGVALCITGVAVEERTGLIEQIGTVFARLFNIQQHLDLLFPSMDEERQLSRVCRPFFVRGGSPSRTETDTLP
jgi:hypothetical protein